MSTTRTESVTVPDGSFDLHLWMPEAGHGPGLVLIQEIFGVGSYIRAVGERLAELGYVVGAPDMFWRQHANWEADHDEAGMAGSFELVQKVEEQQAIADCLATLDALGALEEVDGQPGIIGFCFGGTMAVHAAIHGDPSVAVSYYGTGVPSVAGQLDAVRCPVLMHFGADDTFIPVEGPRQVESAVADRENIEVHIHAGAGHAFDNHEAAVFHQPEAAGKAWDQTTTFLNRHLPAS